MYVCMCICVLWSQTQVHPPWRFFDWNKFLDIKGGVDFVLAEVCMHACMYVCMYAPVFMYVCVCVYVCMYVCVCVVRSKLSIVW